MQLITPSCISKDNGEQETQKQFTFADTETSYANCYMEKWAYANCEQDKANEQIGKLHYENVYKPLTAVRVVQSSRVRFRVNVMKKGMGAIFWWKTLIKTGPRERWQNNMKQNATGVPHNVSWRQAALCTCVYSSSLECRLACHLYIVLILFINRLTHFKMHLTLKTDIYFAEKKASQGL